MLEYEQQFGQWRFKHVQLVERVIGPQTGGTGGTLGSRYLMRTIDQRFFPTPLGGPRASSSAPGRALSSWARPKRDDARKPYIFAMPEPIYLDHAATTPVRPEVLEAMLPFYGPRFGNPSSVHRWGRDARTALDEARERVARLSRRPPDEICFTSGGTEADNLAILGAWRARRDEGRNADRDDADRAQGGARGGASGGA